MAVEIEKVEKVGKLDKKEQKDKIPKTKEQKRNIWEILVLSIIAVGIIGYFDGFAPLPYALKATGKICLFIGTPLLYSRRHPSFSVKKLFALEKKPLKLAGLLGFGVFSLILGSYILLQNVVDLSAVTGELESRMNINASNFMVVALYIATCNSFLEEFFFRGFLFFRLKENCSVFQAHLLSSVIFALYHVAIMVTWFEWWVFTLCMIALVIGGVLFNLLDESTVSLYPSWLTHGCANLAINTIGMILFYN